MAGWIVVLMAAGIPLLHGSNKPESGLLCMCNDHQHCYRELALSEGQLTATGKTTGDSKSDMTDKVLTTGVCQVDSGGRCYTAKLVVVKEAATPAPGNTKGASDTSAYIEIRYGCISSHEKSTLACNGHLPKHAIPKTIACCNSSNLCNRDLDPKFVNHDSSSAAVNAAIVFTVGAGHSVARTSGYILRIVLLTACSFAILLLATTLAVVCYTYRRRIKRHRFLGGGIPSLGGGSALTPLTGRTTTSEADPCLPSHQQQVSNGTASAPRILPSSASTMTVPAVSVVGGPNQTSMYTSNSASGTGTGLLVQRTIGKQIRLYQRIGHGRFGEVWSGEWCGEAVAVKLFHAGDPLAESVWRRATRLHRSTLLRHEAVQGLVAADRVLLDPGGVDPCWSGVGGCCWVTLPILIADLHPWGSLRDLMTRTRWRQEEGTEAMYKTVVNMAFSLASGLTYLHTEISGTRGKPGISHRDLKPANVYVKADWSCCIGDLGLALRSPPAASTLHDTTAASWTPSLPNSVSMQTNVSSLLLLAAPALLPEDVGGGSEERDWVPIGGLQAGTPRYMAPEILLCSSQQPYQFNFDAYKKADVYALGLILWELVAWANPALLSPWQNLCEEGESTQNSTNSTYCPAYQPYLDAGQGEPTLVQMVRIAGEERRRPYLPPPEQDQSSASDPGSGAAVWPEFLRLIPECWHDYPDLRLTALRVKKRLIRLVEQLAAGSGSADVTLPRPTPAVVAAASDKAIGCEL